MLIQMKALNNCLQLPVAPLNKKDDIWLFTHLQCILKASMKIVKRNQNNFVQDHIKMLNAGPNCKHNTNTGLNIAW